MGGSQPPEGTAVLRWLLLGARLWDWDTGPSSQDPRHRPATCLTCTNAQKRGSLRCLALSCSKANDWRLQKREEIFWNQEPSAPSNYSEIQAREGVSGGREKSRASLGDGG